MEIQDGWISYAITLIKYLDLQDIGEPKELKCTLGSIIILKHIMDLPIFITLSCAEYMWPDINRLIIERFTIAGLDIPDLDKSFVQIINDYTLIVQEYFQERVKIWLSTIGTNVFHIKHYWLRYEFAPSRGQIHAHILAIHDNPTVMEPFYTNSTNKDRK